MIATQSDRALDSGKPGCPTARQIGDRHDGLQKPSARQKRMVGLACKHESDTYMWLWALAGAGFHLRCVNGIGQRSTGRAPACPEVAEFRMESSV
jgi:hypothetical protein